MTAGCNATKESLLSPQLLAKAGITYTDNGFLPGTPDPADSYHEAKNPEAALTLDKVISKVWDYHKKLQPKECTDAERFEFYEASIKLYSSQALSKAQELQSLPAPVGKKTVEDKNSGYLRVGTTSDDICRSAGILLGGEENAHARFPGICGVNEIFKMLFGGK